jgi:dolichyl-phosphate beta-glucosyltransferase
MARPFLSIVIPAYNEAKRLPLTLIDIDRHLSQQDFSYEIVTVISKGDDQTAQIVERLATMITNLKVITLPDNRGRGYALRTGMSAAKGSWKLAMDADNSANIVEFLKMRPYLAPSGDASATERDNVYDIVIGSRYLSGSSMSPKPSSAQQLRASIWRFFSKIFFIRKISDTQCGFKCFSASAADTIFPLVQANGWAFDLEALILAKKKKLKIKEIPIFWACNNRKKNTFSRAMSFIGEAVGVWFRRILGNNKN